MAFAYLQEQAKYEERYDATTVALCRDREALVVETLGMLPDIRIAANQTTMGFITCTSIVFELLESVAGERWQQREATITEWMEADHAKDRRLAEAIPSVTPYCPSCGADMELRRRNYLHRDTVRLGDREDIVFLFGCEACNKRRALWQDGTMWDGLGSRCSQCHAAVEATTVNEKNVLVTISTCHRCGHKDREECVLGVTAEEPPDPRYTVDRRRFCFDKLTGQKYLDKKAQLQRLKAVREQIAGSNPVAQKQTADAAKQLTKLTIVQLATRLTPVAKQAGYIDLKLGPPTVGRDVSVSFTILDASPTRDKDASRTDLRTALTPALTGTNWRLMKQDFSYRVGSLEGTLRVYERDDALEKLIEKEIQGGIRDPLPPVPLPRPTRSPRPTAPKKKTRRQAKPGRPIRVTATIHANLRLLIPPREEPELPLTTT